LKEVLRSGESSEGDALVIRPELTVLDALLRIERIAMPDRDDQILAVVAEHQAVSGPRDCQVGWHNPASGLKGSVTRLDDGRSRDGRHCRRYLLSIERGEQTYRISGASCPGSAGKWEIVEE
jgi:surface antigen